MLLVESSSDAKGTSGFKNEFLLTTNDASGKVVRTAGESFKVEMFGPGTTMASVDDNKNGTYTIVYQVSTGTTNLQPLSSPHSLCSPHSPVSLQ